MQTGEWVSKMHFAFVSNWKRSPAGSVKAAIVKDRVEGLNPDWIDITMTNNELSYI